MMKEPSVLLSFIIPVYNGQNTVSNTIESIFNQKTNIRYEVIAINDGSTDDSENVLRRYMSKSNFLLKTINNSGVSVARNEGLSLAHGQYVVFIDCDDKVPEHYSEIVKSLLDQGPQMICGNYCVIDDDVCEHRLDLVDGTIHLGPHAGFNEFLFGNLEKQINGTLSNKVYSMDIIKKYSVSFIPGKTMSEDWMFNADYLENVQCIHTTSATLFDYCRNLDSVTQNYNPNYTQDIINFIDDITNLANKYNYDLNGKDLASFYLKRWFGVLNNEARNEDKEKGYESFKRYLTQPFFRKYLKRLTLFVCTAKEIAYKWITLLRLDSIVYSIVYKKYHD